MFVSIGSSCIELKTEQFKHLACLSRLVEEQRTNSSPLQWMSLDRDTAREPYAWRWDLLRHVTYKRKVFWSENALRMYEEICERFTGVFSCKTKEVLSYRHERLSVSQPTVCQVFDVCLPWVLCRCLMWLKILSCHMNTSWKRLIKQNTYHFLCINVSLCNLMFSSQLKISVFLLLKLKWSWII